MSGRHGLSEYYLLGATKKDRLSAEYYLTWCLRISWWICGHHEDLLLHYGVRIRYCVSLINFPPQHPLIS